MENIIEKRIGTVKHFKDYYLKFFWLIGILALAGVYILWATVYHYDVTAVSVMIIGNGETDSLAGLPLQKSIE